ncbi:MAG TPA: polysaccharide lyase family 8 super-sandwich domain-containing protein [Candidatus Acidoferrum sp.]|nr:polysaccharide lyase family 8 super-sandwich domain-containing protein [Candidatus Acidoferrum sp.]
MLAYDPFTDGNRTNATGGDTQGLVWYMGQTWGSLDVTDDSGGIGTGNALLFTPTAAWGKFLAYFGPVTLTNPGDSVTLTFNFRFTSNPTNISAGFRVGLYNSMGTRQTTDASDTATPGPGDRSDDVGYGFQTNPGLNSSSGLNVYSEAAGNDILGGSSPSQTANQGSAGTSFAFGTNTHFALFQIALQPSGNLALTAYVDNGLAANASIPAASVFTNAFDELAMEEGGTGWWVPWLVDNVQIVTTSGSDFDLLRTNWWQLQTGGTSYSLTDSQVKSRFGTITNNAVSWQNSMDKTGTNTYLWSDLTSTTSSSQISSAYQRLQEMALAYATYGCALYSNATLATNIQIGLNWMYTNRYNLSIAAPAGEYDNWWDWEIGSPLYMVDICAYMYTTLGTAGLSNTLNALDHFVPSPFSGTSGTSTGGNLTDKIRVVSVRGAVARDASKLTLAANAFSSLFQYVTSGDGYYADGSFIQHTHHPYTCSYGLVAINDTSLVLPWLTGAPWQYTTNRSQTNVIVPWRCADPAYTNVMQWVYNGYQPLLYSGAAMDMTRGRAVSRYSNQDHVAGSAVEEWLLTLAVSPFPTASDAAQIKSIVKYLAQVDTYRSFTSNIPLQLVVPTEQLMSNNAIVPRGELLGHWTFGGMDRAVHLRPGWGFGLSISSSRVYNYESINSENLHGWFQGDGVTYLYNGDLTQFSDDFWPTVDPYRLPGTTVETTTRANSAGQSYLSSKNWVGGVTLFTNGAAGMDLAPYSSPLTGKKSWFMLDDEVVCLGAGVTCNNGMDVQTTAVNRKISSGNTNAFVMDGITMPTTLGWQTNHANTSWCYLDALGGCYFPGRATINALRQSRTSSWSQINAGGTTGSTTKNYLTLWFDHGTNPSGGTYSYVLLPNYTSAQVSSYAAAPEVTILENSTSAQAVKETTLNVVAANIWTNGSKTVDLITASTKASIMTQETPGTALAVAVADPTHTNTGSILLTLSRAANSVVSLDPLITVMQLRPTIQLSASTANTFGRTLLATFNLQNSPPSLAPIANRSLGAGATLVVTNSANDADLPYQTLTFSLAGAPTGATIDPNSGLLTWRVPAVYGGTSNLLSVVVTDNGSPSLSATQTFAVVVSPLDPPLLSATTTANGYLSLAVTGDAGPDYSVQASTNLVDWATLFKTNQPALPMTWTDTNAALFSARFYRVLLGP